MNKLDQEQLLEILDEFWVADRPEHPGSIRSLNELKRLLMKGVNEYRLFDNRKIISGREPRGRALVLDGKPYTLNGPDDWVINKIIKPHIGPHSGRVIDRAPVSLVDAGVVPHPSFPNPNIPGIPIAWSRYGHLVPKIR